MEPETLNKFLVCDGGEDIYFVIPIPQRIAKADAILIAAYLVILAEPYGNERYTRPTFALQREAIENA